MKIFQFTVLRKSFFTHTFGILVEKFPTILLSAHVDIVEIPTMTCVHFAVEKMV